MGYNHVGVEELTTLESMRLLMRILEYLSDARVAVVHREYVVVKWRLESAMLALNGLGISDGRGGHFDLSADDEERGAQLEMALISGMSQINDAGDALFMRDGVLSVRRHLENAYDKFAQVAQAIDLWRFESSLGRS